MNTFAFNPRERFEKQYAYILRQIKKNDHMRDMIKIGILVAALVFFIFIYLYFISLASTRGYFLRQAIQKRTSISFEQEIIKTQVLKIRQQNRETMKEYNLQAGSKAPQTIRIDISPTAY